MFRSRATNQIGLRHVRAAQAADEAGDTLIEILLALVILSLTIVAIITAFATTISASSDHRTLATGDAVLKSFIETATNEIQYQSSPDFIPCATASAGGSSYDASVVSPFNSSSVATQNHFSISIISISPEGPGCPGNPTHPPPQLITAKAHSLRGLGDDVLSFVVADPDAAAAGTVTVTPSSGPVAGGTTVTIAVSNGNFAATPAPTVAFGSVPATSVSLTSAPGVSPAIFTATSPAGTDTVDVTVTDSLGTTSTTVSDQFTYAPNVTSITPTQGDTNTLVSIAGSGFSNVSAVTFGGIPSTSVTFNDPHSLTVMPPPGSGTVHVQVTTPRGGTSLATPADLFTYGVSVLSLSPNAGPDLGGTVVTITGTGFVVGQAATVTFGGVNATNVTVTSPTTITATSPAGTRPIVDVQVTQGSATSPINQPEDQFTYNPGTVVGLGISLKPGGSSGTPVLSCGAPGATDSCTISGTGKGGNANYYVVFVDAQGIASVYSTTLDSTIAVNGQGTATSVVILHNTSTSTQPVNSNHNGNSNSTTTVTFGSFTMTVTVKS
jgi:hypothetical protein